MPMLKTEQQLENYYNSIIKNFLDEDQVTHFLNKADIYKKFDDEDREWLMLRWLSDNGWIEIEEEEVKEGEEVMVMEVWPFPTTKPETEE